MTYTEIIRPAKPEKAYYDIMQELGTDEVLVLYEDETKDLSHLEHKYDIPTYTGLIDSNKPHPITFKKGSRHNVERYKFKFHYGFEHFSNNDHMHYRKSGMNDVIAKLLNDRDKYYVIDMESVITSPEPQILLGRIRQNLKLARKYDFNVIIAGMNRKPNLMRHPEEYKSLIRSLGYEQIAKHATQQLHKALKNIEEHE